MMLTTDSQIYKELTQSYVSKNRYHEAALIIYQFRLIGDFDILMILDKLVELKDIKTLKMICSLDQQVLTEFLTLFCDQENSKMTSQIILAFNKELLELSEIKEKLYHNKMMYTFRQLKFLKQEPGSSFDYYFDRIEDLFSGNKKMLLCLVEDLVFKGKINEAKGVVKRNTLEKLIRQTVRAKLGAQDYDSALDPPLYDLFGPLSTS